MGVQHILATMSIYYIYYYLQEGLKLLTCTVDFRNEKSLHNLVLDACENDRHRVGVCKCVSKVSNRLTRE